MTILRGSLLALAMALSLSVTLAEEVEVTKLEITPATKPVPAMRYRLYPSERQLQPGNAAALYYRSMIEMTHPGLADERKRIAEVLDIQENFSIDEANKLLKVFQPALDELKIAARRNKCDWDVPLREFGVFTLLTDMQHARELARLVLLQARVQALEGKFEAAVESLETAVVLARHVSQSGTLVSSLIGAAIFGKASDQIEQMAALPGSPSLYSALTALPNPLVDLRIGIESELLWPAGTLPHFQQMETAILSPKQADELGKALGGLLADGAVAEGQEKLSAEKELERALAGYERCKQQLIERGREPAMVNAMPKVQVVTLRGIEVLRDMLDEQIAYVGHPQAEVSAALESLGEQGDAISQQPEGYLVKLLLPATQAAKMAFTRHSQRIDLLRVIEALRLHAGLNGGKLPARLSDVSAVPVPLDPASGKPFDYKLEGGKAIILPAPLPFGVRYEITVRK